MIRQVIFQPNALTGADGWTETGTPVGVAQPPNRALPAPIFDDGSAYSPHNGTIGNWVIRKTVVSDVAGPGFLTIPAGTYPGSGGIYADDIVSGIRVNGVVVPFTGLGSGTVPAQSQPVTWLLGNNTVDIEVANTIAGNTSLTGQLIAAGAGVPCDCCSVGTLRRCATIGGVSQDVFSCRRPNGTVEWYDVNGSRVAADQVGPCEPLTPFVVPSLRMNGFFFGDDGSGTAENLCAVTPAPSASTGFNAPVGGCYDPVPGNPSMTWTNTSMSEMTFGDNGNGQSSGAVQVNFQYDASNLVQWPTNGNQMLVGEQRWSNVFGGNQRARLTLVSANTTVTVNMLGGPTIGVHWNQGGVVQIRYRVEFFTV